MKLALHPASVARHDRPTTPGVADGRLVFTSGQVGAGDDAYAQTRDALGRLDAILAEAGGSLADLVKVTVYVAELESIPDINRAYAELVPAPYPARSCVQAGLARAELRVEIEGVAVVDGGQSAARG